MPAAPPPNKKNTGLHAIEQAREDRSQKKYRMTPGVGFVAAGVLVAAAVMYKCVNERDVTRAREVLLDKQKSGIETLGAEWFPLRDKIEKQILDAAKDYAGDAIDPALPRFDFRSMPGIYLRLRVAEAKTIEDIRRVAADAKKDAFAGCLLRPSERAREDAGAFPEQPWNLGQAYASTRILNDSFTTQVSEADDLMRLRVLEKQYEQAVKTDITLAARVVKNAEFFLLVLDEDVAEASAQVDGGAVTEATLQLVPHPARVFLFNLKDGREMLRVKRVGSAMTMPAGERVDTDVDTENKMRRQVNNCALAGQVEAAIVAGR